MAYTKGEIRGLVQTEVLVYLPTIRLDPRTIDYNVKRAEMDVYRFYRDAQEEKFRTSVTVSDGANLTERFDIIANQAINTNDDSTATWLVIENVPFRKSNQYDLATVTSCSYSICNQQWLILPNTETLQIWIYQRPLDYSGDSYNDSTSSTMPEQLRYLVMLGAAKYCMETVMALPSQYKLSQQDLENAQAALTVFGSQYQKTQDQNRRLS